MNFFQKYGLIGLTIALLFPTIFINSHVFSHEFKFGCNEHSTTHLHKSTVDCNICKFHPTPIVGLFIYNYKLALRLPIQNSFTDSYLFLSDFQKLSFQLRGPPSSLSA